MILSIRKKARIENIWIGEFSILVLERKLILNPESIPEPNKKKNLLDRMGMNEEMLDHPTSNLEFWFFPKFVILCNTYKIKSWVIPIKILF